ncbi:MAG: NAD(P)-dependent oxidoreductase [Solirubrobacteraceae bacterium]|nr:NAD(P)-dependent oxidoreductase [Solirubrobacteraceae bacterium]
MPIAVLGFGEAGGLISRDLVAAGADVRGYDPRVAVPDGVLGRADEADAVRDADIVLSVNSALDAEEALRNALPALRPGTIWADLNTGSPGLKRRLAATAAERGAVVVDVALMATVPGNGLRTPMVVSGEETATARYARVLGALGARVEVMAGPAGVAISRKLLRSVFYKGTAAAVVEALAAARAAGCEDWLREMIADELARFSRQTLDRLVDGSHRHARRRAEEMAAATEQLRELGVAPLVADAARRLLADLAGAAEPPGPRDGEQDAAPAAGPGAPAGSAPAGAAGQPA